MPPKSTIYLTQSILMSHKFMILAIFHFSFSSGQASQLNEICPLN